MTVQQCHMVGNGTCDPPPDFILNYNGFTTDSLSSDVAPSALQAALNSLPSISSAGSVAVSMESSDNKERVYKVKFVFTEPESTILLKDASQVRGFVRVELDKAGIRSTKGFSLSLDGVRSMPIHADNTQEKMTEVIRDLFTTQCTYSTRFGKCIVLYVPPNPSQANESILHIDINFKNLTMFRTKQFIEAIIHTNQIV